MHMNIYLHIHIHIYIYKKNVHHVPKFVSYYGAIGGLETTGRAHCLSF